MHCANCGMFPGGLNDSGAADYVLEESFPLLMPRWGYSAAAFVLFLIGFFGFFLNLLVILLMFKDRQLWTPLNIILFNLVCSDFSVSVLGNPFTLVSALFHHWIFGHTMCVLYGFFMALLGIVSITTLTVLSFERYMMVSRPFSSRHLSSRGALYMVLFIWTYSLALTTPPLFGWGNYINESANISCSVNWHEQTFNTLTYILFLFATGQILPLGVIGYSYYNIVRTMKQNSKRMGRVSRAEARVTVMVFIMIISFMVAWTPYSILALMEQFAHEKKVSPGVSVIPALVAKSSICYDPLIYVGMNTQFRQSIKRIFGIHSKNVPPHATNAYDITMLSPQAARYSSDATKPTITINKKSCHSKNKFKSNADESIQIDLTTNEIKTLEKSPNVSDKRNTSDTTENSVGSSKSSSQETPSNDTISERQPLQKQSSPEFITIIDTENILLSIDRKTKRPKKITFAQDYEANKKRSLIFYNNTAYEEFESIKVIEPEQEFDVVDADLSAGNVRRMKQSTSFDVAWSRAKRRDRKLSFDTDFTVSRRPSWKLKNFNNTITLKEDDNSENFLKFLCDNKTKNDL